MAFFINNHIITITIILNHSWETDYSIWGETRGLSCYDIIIIILILIKIIKIIKILKITIIIILNHSWETDVSIWGDMRGLGIGFQHCRSIYNEHHYHHCNCYHNHIKWWSVHCVREQAEKEVLGSRPRWTSICYCSWYFLSWWWWWWWHLTYATVPGTFFF